jgi:integrase
VVQVQLAARRLHAFLSWQYARDRGCPAPADFDPPADSITERDIQHWRTWLAQGERDGRGGWRRKPCSAHTVHSYHAALRQLWRYATELRPPLVAANPVNGVRNKRPQPVDPDIWDRGEIASLLWAIRRIRWQDRTMPIRWSAIVYGLLHGMRINEITTLRRIDLRPADRLVLVRARDDSAGQWWQWKTKGRRDRAVGISGRYARVLQRLLCVCPWMFPHLSRRACANRIARIGDLTWRQKQQPYSVVNRDFNAIVAQANVIRLGKGQPMIAVAYPHMGRKTAATQLAGDGVHPAIMSAIMGFLPETANRYYIRVEQGVAIAKSQASFSRIGRRPAPGE